MRFAIFAFWILLFGSTQGRAEIVRVRFAGTITQPAPDAPHSFSAGEAIWGTYAFDSKSELIEDSYGYNQFPALRFFTIESTSGFFAQINWGIIIADNYPNKTLPANIYKHQVATLPPLISARSPFPDRPNAAGDVVEYVTNLAFDDEAVWQMIDQSQSLGFPGLAGAFLQESPPWISLTFSSPESQPDLITPVHGYGVITYGPIFSSNYPAISFAITELIVVPEPGAMAIVCSSMAWFFAYVNHASRR